jgi:lipoprotein-releasing system permease protein
MIMMIVSVATGIGLQQKIREKISFNGHIIISNYDNNQSEVTLVPISKKQDFYPKFDVVEGSVIFRLSPVKQELLELKMLLKE